MNPQKLTSGGQNRVSPSQPASGHAAPTPEPTPNRSPSKRKTVEEVLQVLKKPRITNLDSRKIYSSARMPEWIPEMFGPVQADIIDIWGWTNSQTSHNSTMSRRLSTLERDTEQNSENVKHFVQSVQDSDTILNETRETLSAETTRSRSKSDALEKNMAVKESEYHEKLTEATRKTAQLKETVKGQATIVQSLQSLTRDQASNLAGLKGHIERLERSHRATKDEMENRFADMEKQYRLYSDNIEARVWTVEGTTTQTSDKFKSHCDKIAAELQAVRNAVDETVEKTVNEAMNGKVDTRVAEKVDTLVAERAEAVIKEKADKVMEDIVAQVTKSVASQGEDLFSKVDECVKSHFADQDTKYDQTLQNLTTPNQELLTGLSKATEQISLLENSQKDLNERCQRAEEQTQRLSVKFQSQHDALVQRVDSGFFDVDNRIDDIHETQKNYDEQTTASLKSMQNQYDTSDEKTRALLLDGTQRIDEISVANDKHKNCSSSPEIKNLEDEIAALRSKTDILHSFHIIHRRNLINHEGRIETTEGIQQTLENFMTNTLKILITYGDLEQRDAKIREWVTTTVVTNAENKIQEAWGQYTVAEEEKLNTRLDESSASSTAIAEAEARKACDELHALLQKTWNQHTISLQQGFNARFEKSSESLKEIAKIAAKNACDDLGARLQGKLKDRLDQDEQITKKYHTRLDVVEESTTMLVNWKKKASPPRLK